MGVHLYESGIYRDRAGETVYWAVADSRGRTFEKTPEHTELTRFHPLLDALNLDLSKRGSGPEAGTVQLLALSARLELTEVWALSWHAHLHIPRDNPLGLKARVRPVPLNKNRHVLTRIELQTPEGRAWENTVAPATVLQALAIWRTLKVEDGKPALIPLPTLCSAANAAAPYEYPSRRMTAEWVKKEFLAIPSDPSLQSTFQHIALRRVN